MAFLQTSVSPSLHIKLVCVPLDSRGGSAMSIASRQLKTPDSPLKIPGLPKSQLGTSPRQPARFSLNGYARGTGADQAEGLRQASNRARTP